MSWGARATGLSRPTIIAGLRALQLPAKERAAAAARVRRPGGGRRAVTVTDPQGLVVKAALDTRRYETAIEVSDAEFAQVQLTPHAFHGDWNYTISPHH